MATKIFVNLPVNDLKKSMDFFTKLGFRFNPQFTDETGACMIVSETVRHATDSAQVQSLYSQRNL
jgi:predicted lactoylglutathione lyase